MTAQTQTIPRWKIAAPAGGKIGLPIGGKEGRFEVQEIAVYFDYLSPEGDVIDSFEFNLRVPMTKKNRRRSDEFWEFIASVKMEEKDIHITSEHWDVGIDIKKGWRYVGRTNAWKPRYNIIKKHGRDVTWHAPPEGGWGTLSLGGIE
jgi:hypothetical protein